MPSSWLDGRLGAEATPRPGFAEDLEARLQSEWRGEPHVAPPATPRRRRWPVLVWGGAAAALVVAIALVLVRRDDDHTPVGPATTTTVAPAPTTSSPSSSSVAPSTSTPAPTVPASTVPGSTVTPTPTPTPSTVATRTGTTLAAPLASGGQVWGRDCTETEPQGPSTAGGTADASLGPLGAVPLATLTYGGTEPSAADPSSVRTADVPGGLLFVVDRDDPDAGPGSVATLIGADGRARWTRCWPGVSLQLLATGDTYALVQTSGPSPTVELVDLADGSRRGLLADYLASAGVDTTGFDLSALDTVFRDDRDLVFASTQGGTVDPDVDRLLRIDLASLGAETLPLPAVAAGAAVVQLERNANGDLLLLDARQEPAAALVDGTWSTDPADLSRWSGVRADWAFDVAGQPLRGTDGQGNVVWTSDQVFNSLLGEAAGVQPIGAMTVGLACAEPVDTSSFTCPGEVHLVGVRTADGAVVWTLPAAGLVAGDRLAIVSDAAVGAGGDGWVLIDTTTGSQVEGWSSDVAAEFTSECCGGDETNRTEVHGGTVVTIHDGVIHVWAPAATPATNVAISLP